MSLQRRIGKLNRLLATELGDKPLYGWQHTDSRELSYPMLVYEEDSSAPDGMRPLHDYKCVCGTNVRVHTPWCKLSIAAPRVAIRPLIQAEDCRNSWVLAVKLYPNEVEWQQAYGTSVQYPRNGQWMAVSSGVVTLIIPNHAEPTEAKTDQVIRMIRESRSITPGQWTTLWAEQKNREEAQSRQNKRDYFREQMGITLNPGKSGGGVSLPTPERLKFRGTNSKRTAA